MASVLCVTNGLPGILYSSLELARRLREAGHRLTYVSFPEAEATVVEHGFEFLAIPRSRYDEFCADDAARGLLSRLVDVGARRRHAARATEAHELVVILQRLGPDLLLIDGEMHEHVIAASVTGVRMALLNTFVSIWRHPGLPPPNRFALPGRGWRGTTLATSLMWLELRLKKLRRSWRHKIVRVGCDRQSVLRELAREAGFDVRDRVDFGQWPIPFTYRGIPVLCLHALEFEFPHEPRPEVHYVGPMVPAARADAGDEETRRSLEAIFERCRGDDARKLIYAGFGSFFSTDPAFVRRLLDAVSARRDWELVVSLGRRIEADALGRLPDNAHAFAWVPQLEMLRHADVAVTHGGINTIDECVVAGVPMLVYCGHETDMAGNTARVVYHELGIAGDRGDDADTIRTHLDNLLSTPELAAGIDELRRRYAKYTRERVAEDVVAGLLDSAATDHSSN
jgi:UDP:flavonoid glycosyltransferase YjiC (YdhE family)